MQTQSLRSVPRLTCKTSMQWFFCMWNSPQREQSCAIQLGQPTSVCAASNKSVLIGSKHSCDLQLQVRSSSVLKLFKMTLTAGVLVLLLSSVAVV